MEFEAMVDKGTAAWKGVPDDFLEQLRDDVVEEESIGPGQQPTLIRNHF